MATKQKKQVKPVTESEIKALQDVLRYVRLITLDRSEDPVTRAYLRERMQIINNLTDKLIDNGYTKD